MRQQCHYISLAPVLSSPPLLSLKVAILKILIIRRKILLAGNGNHSGKAMMNVVENIKVLLTELMNIIAIIMILMTVMMALTKMREKMLT